MTERPDRNIAMELVRVTEAAALAAGRWIGRGDKEAADGAAVDAMRLMIDTVSMNGVVVIGEGEKDEAPMLFNGEEVGNGEGPGTDVAVDPIDGTTLTAHRPGERPGGDRARRARHDVLPRRRRLHGEDRRAAPRRPARSTSRSRPTRTSAGSRRPRACAPRRSPSRSSTARDTRTIIEAIRDAWARGST